MVDAKQVIIVMLIMGFSIGILMDMAYDLQNNYGVTTTSTATETSLENNLKGYLGTAANESNDASTSLKNDQGIIPLQGAWSISTGMIKVLKMVFLPIQLMTTSISDISKIFGLPDSVGTLIAALIFITLSFIFIRALLRYKA